MPPNYFRRNRGSIAAQTPWPRLLALLCCVACSGPDTRTVEGFLAATARAVEADDSRKLYRLLDERSRNALFSIVRDRHKAAALVREHYPEPDRSQTLARLGDAVEAADAAELFARRCSAPCRKRIADRVAAPRRVTQDGDETVVVTVRDGRLRLYRGSDERYGLVWNTEALADEHKQAARDVEQIEQHAAIYARRQALDD